MSFTDARHEYRNVIDRINEATNKEEVEYQKDHETYKWRTVTALERIEKLLGALLTNFQLTYTRDGQLFSNRVQITAPTQTIQIDFKRPGQSILPSGWPAGTRVNAPFKPIPELIIINEGPGNLLFSIVKTKGDATTMTTLPAPATDSNPVPLILNWGQPTVERINLNVSATLTCNLIAVL